MLVKRRIPNRVWLSTPQDPNFTQGVAGAYDLTPHLRDGASSLLLDLAENSNPLGSGVTVDQGLKRLVYDGAGSAGTANGVRLQISDSTSATNDFLSRTAAAFYRQDFSGYADSAAMRGDADLISHLDGVHEVHLCTDPAIATLSGGRCLESRMYDTAGKGGSWGQNWGNRYERFYFTFAIRHTDESLYWRFHDQDNGKMKLCNIEQFANGQVVVMNGRFMGQPSLMMNGGGMLNRFISPLLPGTGFDAALQCAIDNLAPSSPATLEQFIQRYGLWWKGIQDREWSGANAGLGDFAYKDSATTGGNYLLNMLNHTSRGHPHGGYGWPDIRPTQCVDYRPHRWVTHQVFVENTSTTRHLKMWAAEYGDPPKLIVDYDYATGIGAREFDLSYNSNYYTQNEFLFYDTPVVDGSFSEAGYRPLIKIYFAEAAAALTPMAFPGGFMPPGHLG